MSDNLVSLAVHNAYHFGKIVALRQMLGTWTRQRLEPVKPQEMLNASVLPCSLEVVMQTKTKLPTIVLTEPVWIIGLELRTSNEVAFETIPAHWQRFMNEEILKRIPNRASETIYAVYTNYQNPGVNNHGIYSCVLGTAITNHEHIPDGLVAVSLPASTYQVVSVESADKVGVAWQEIWQQDTSGRTFIADTECYYPDGRVEIHLGIRG